MPFELSAFVKVKYITFWIVICSVTINKYKVTTILVRLNWIEFSSVSLRIDYFVGMHKIANCQTRLVGACIKKSCIICVLT